MVTSSPSIVMGPSDCGLLELKENDRVRITGPGGEAVVLLLLSESMVEPGVIAVSDPVCSRIGAKDGDEVDVVFSPMPESVRAIRRKMEGEKLDGKEIESIVDDIYHGSLSDIEVSAWLTALHIQGMDLDEIASFARAMVSTGDVVKFDKGPVFDFHSMGGVPGNKVTPIVVSIVAAAGLMVPKTSSRAISSGCGTSDFVETFCDVNTTVEDLKRLGESVGGAFVWGGSLELAPVDDIAIKVQHPLGINPRAQMLAAIMGKKLAVSADYLLMDIPTGSGTKVPSIEDAKRYAKEFMELGERLGIHVECAVTYADQPVGSAIGPILEAKECIQVLEGSEQQSSVVEKACQCAGILLEMAGFQNGEEMAYGLLRSGKAHSKFLEIVAAQGGSPTLRSDDLVPGRFVKDLVSARSGYVHSINNKDLVAIVKALGSPRDKGAGLVLHKRKGQRVVKGDVLLTMYAENEDKLERAMEIAQRYTPVVIEGMLLSHVTSSDI